MTLNDALIILQITSINDLSSAEFKRIKRNKIKLLHPDKKKTAEEKVFFNNELRRANAAIEIVEKHLKLNLNNRQKEHKSYRETQKEQEQGWYTPPPKPSEREGLEKILKNRKISTDRVVINYFLCTLIFWFTGPFAFIFSLICVALDYMAFKHTWACTTKPYAKMGGLIEFLGTLKDDKKENLNPTLYPFSRFVIDMGLLPFLILIGLLVSSALPPVLCIVAITPFYVIWRIYLLLTNSCLQEDRVVAVLGGSS